MEGSSSSSGISGRRSIEADWLKPVSLECSSEGGSTHLSTELSSLVSDILSRLGFQRSCFVSTRTSGFLDSIIHTLDIAIVCSALDGPTKICPVVVYAGPEFILDSISDRPWGVE